MRLKRRKLPGDPGGKPHIDGEGRAENAFPRGEEHFRKLIENAMDLVVLLLADGTITYVGPSVWHLLGYDPVEMTGENIISFIHPEEVEGARAALAFAAGRPGDTKYFELRVLHRDGSWRLHEASARNLLGDPGIGGLVINSRDITERKQAERLIELQRDLEVKLGATTDQFEALSVSLDVILEATGLDCGRIYILENETGGLRLVQHRGLSQAFVDTARYYDAASSQTALVRAGEVLFLSYEESPAEKTGAHVEEGLKVGAFSPIIVEGQIIGCIDLASHEMEEVPAVTRNILEIMLGRVGQILARIRLNAAIRKSEERYRLLHDYAGEAIFTFDRDLVLRSVNHATVEKIGYGREEIQGRNVLELGVLHPDDHARVVRSIERLFAGESPTKNRLRLIAKDGSVKLFDVTSAGIFDDEGNIVAVSNVALDITEQAKAEEALRRSEEYFRALIEKSTDVITILDATGVIIYESPSLQQFLGYRPEELTGRNVFDYLHPDDTPVALAAFWKGLDIPGDSSYIEVRFRHKDGSWRWFGGTGRNLLDDPAVHGILLNSHDITERVEIEHALLDSKRAQVTLLSNLPGMAYRCRVDPDWTMEFVSEGSFELTGYRPEELVDDPQVAFGSHLIRPDFREYVQREVQEALKMDRAYELVYPITTRQGTEKWVWERGRGVHYPRGNIFIEGFISDITDRKQAEEALRIQRDLAFRLSGESDLASVLKVSLRAILDTSGLESGAVYLVDEETGALDLAFSLGLSRDFVESARHLEADSAQAAVVREGRAVFGRVRGAELAMSDRLNAEGIKSVYIVPILHEGRAVGSVLVSSHTSEEISQHVRDIVEILAGQIAQAVARARLISALGDSEKKYRLLHDHAGEAIFTYDRELRLTSINRIACEEIGFSEEELLGRSVLDLGIIYDEDMEVTERNIEELLSKEREVVREEIRFRHRDGSIIIADVSSAALYDDNGEVMAITNIATDVTEQRRAEEALKTSETTYREIFNAANDGIFVHDLETGAILDVNEKMGEMYGVSRIEALGMGVEDLSSGVHPYTGKEAAELVRKAAAGEPQLFEWHAKDANGRLFWVEVSLKRAVIAGTDRVLALVRDISERKKSEEALRSSEERYRATFESTGTAMGIIESDGSISVTNSEFERLVGYTQKEIEGRKRYWEFVHPDDVGTMKAYARDMVSGELPMPFQYECRLRHREGGTLTVLVSVNALPGTTKSVVSLIDITDRKLAEEVLRKSEEQYRATFETTGTAMFLVEENAVLSGANREMEKIFGYSRDEVVGKMKYMQLVMPEEVDKVKRMSSRILRGELEGPIQYEIKARHKSGRAVDALININTIPGTGKSVVSLIDISMNKAYERQLEENAEQMRDFLDVAAHELRHPATLLKGYAMTLEKRGAEIGDENRQACLQGIEAGADRLVYVVDELLNASRLQRGRFSITREEAPLEAIAMKAVEEIRLRGTGRDISLELPDDMSMASVDTDSMMRLFIILLDNAVKYSPHGSAVELKGEVGSGEMIFSVMDRGVGIPLKDREKVFDRFFQVGSVRHHSGPGLGLGLYIGKRIVEAHGGRIWYEPRVGGGSIFRFSVPTAPYPGKSR
ncbi:MAG: PAS domain S-box protein [Actinomycetota bacterium]